MFYAQLNNDNICIGVSQLAGEANDSKLIPIGTFDESYLWRKYENGVWSEKKFIPGTVTLEKEEIELLMNVITEQEALIRTQNEEKIEQLRQDNLILMDALADLYEEILALKEEEA